MSGSGSRVSGQSNDARNMLLHPRGVSPTSCWHILASDWSPAPSPASDWLKLRILAADWLASSSNIFTPITRQWPECQQATIKRLIEDFGWWVQNNRVTVRGRGASSRGRPIHCESEKNDIQFPKLLHNSSRCQAANKSRFLRCSASRDEFDEGKIGKSSSIFMVLSVAFGTRWVGRRIWLFILHPMCCSQD